MSSSPAVSNVERFSSSSDKSERRTSVPGPRTGTHHPARSTNPPWQLRPRTLSPNPLTLFRTEWMDGSVSGWVEGGKSKKHQAPSFSKLVYRANPAIEDSHSTASIKQQRIQADVLLQPSQPAASQASSYPSTSMAFSKSNPKPAVQRPAYLALRNNAVQLRGNHSFDIPPVERY
ncbi:hypothetical protein BDP55DRAFT_628582 [Colletotrichum godetiae]|uniref:Uncharacterized protein n=1 Tax=Colletotrichum godetiae TaxID=1209918 RepID=A0AAJ0F211_9PEZI|nr:uncharacterized protein BDP55DRAFT_628582 [Colletotrichum godetiae]KAK1690058.1 hypothetical protein BDP55DRAFT_628582 [Colletotrichum godetiae]